MASLQANTTANDLLLEISGYDHRLKIQKVFPNCIKVSSKSPTPRYSRNPAANPNPRSDGLRMAFVNDMKLHGAKITRAKEQLEAVRFIAFTNIYSSLYDNLSFAGRLDDRDCR